MEEEDEGGGAVQLPVEMWTYIFSLVIAGTTTKRDSDSESEESEESEETKSGRGPGSEGCCRTALGDDNEEGGESDGKGYCCPLCCGDEGIWETTGEIGGALVHAKKDARSVVDDLNALALVDKLFYALASSNALWLPLCDPCWFTQDKRQLEPLECKRRYMVWLRAALHGYQMGTTLLPYMSKSGDSQAVLSIGVHILGEANVGKTALLNTLCPLQKPNEAKQTIVSTIKMGHNTLALHFYHFGVIPSILPWLIIYY
eukprot:TRINITY_DN7206_c0_g1_i2.p1 TRINITY_DN7206_c0_g1~~TRINITY_DN7206_c0_g1_i2.p1  ORF type:complete len:258 (-),score=32.76 TRINITY_DN7206_c0_g1_i2:29-802(-)